MDFTLERLLCGTQRSEKAKPFPSTRVILKCNEKTTRRKLCKINDFVFIILFLIRLNIRTEADSVLLAENSAKTIIRKNDESNQYKIPLR